MRAVAYVVAALAAVGIMVAIVAMPGQEETTDSANPASAVEATSTRVMTEAGTLTMQVPEMHCPFACYPAIKETLESDQTVTEVQLAEQQVEGVIDNPQVIINFQAGFDIDAAIASLNAKGFKDSTVVQ